MTYQEKLVDGIIADYLESKFVGVKDKLGKTPKYFKRGAKASIMGNDRRIYELIKSLEEKNNTDEYLTYFDELVNAYRKYVEVADCEVKEFGEVMTPITLVEEMLNKLPSDLWSNPNLKWLDPCAGVGTFPSIVVQRLMKGLEEFEKNPIKRYRHIIEEMVYVCELQPKNLFVYHCVFDKDDTNELNTYCGSFLDEKFNKHMNNVWGVEKFDIIIGNPPYQENSDSGRSKGGGKGGDNNLWSKFVLKCLDICDVLCFIHPPSFLSPSHNVLKSFNDKGGISYLKIFDKSPFENASTQACYYIWERGFNNDTKLEGNYTINLKNKFIPNSSNYIDYSIFYKFFSEVNVFSFVRTCSLHTQKNKSFITKEQTEDNTHKFLSGSKIFYTSKQSDFHNDKKVIVSRSGYLNPQYNDGDMSVSESNFCCIVKSKSVGDSIIKLLNTKLYKYILNKSKFSGFFHGDVLKNIPQVPFDREWTDEELYKYFKLSQEEINLIESQTK